MKIISDFWTHHLVWSIIILCILTFIIIHTFICILYAGGSWFPKDKVLHKYLLASSDDIKLSETTSIYFSMNDGNGSIELYIFPLICKWCVDEIGPIPRWYKSHRYIEKLYGAKTSRKKGWKSTKKYKKVFGYSLPE